MFFLWGDIIGEFSDWIQPPDAWRIILYGHEGIGRLNVWPVLFKPNTGILFAPGTRGGHAKVGSPTPNVTVQFDLPTSGQRALALPTYFPVEPEIYHELIMAGESAIDGSERGRAIVWNLLWKLAQPISVIRERDAIYEVEDLIRENLDTKLVVSELATKVDVSQRTLLSWFQAEHGMSVTSYIRQTRAREACRLLVETQLSVKAIANRIGVQDLQQFNKLVHSHVGLAPRTYRARTK